MKNSKFSKEKTVKYLLWTFGLAYLVQFGAAFLWIHVNRTAGQLVTAAMMFVPALGVFLAGGDLKGIGWKPGIRKGG